MICNGRDELSSMTKTAQRQQTRNACQIATEFVNAADAERASAFWAKQKDAGRFLRPLALDPGQESRAVDWLRGLAMALQEAWDPRTHETAAHNLEQIFADLYPESVTRYIRQLEKGRGISKLSTGAKKFEKFERSAFKVRMGSDRPVFEARDILDEIGYAILRASSLGLLRKCKGAVAGWPCKTPFLVADERRRRYCYETCGNLAKAKNRMAKRKRKKT